MRPIHNWQTAEELAEQLGIGTGDLGSRTEFGTGWHDPHNKK